MKKLLIIGTLISLALTGCDGLKGTANPLPTVSLDSGKPQTEVVARTPDAKQANNENPSSSGVTASGVVVSLNQAQFVANTNGSVQAVQTAVGSEVKKGDVLVLLSGREKMKASVEAARLELLSAKQALEAVNRDAAKARAAVQVRLAEANKALDDATRRRDTATSVMGLRAPSILPKRTIFWQRTI